MLWHGKKTGKVMNNKEKQSDSKICENQKNVCYEIELEKHLSTMKKAFFPTSCQYRPSNLRHQKRHARRSYPC